MKKFLVLLGGFTAYFFLEGFIRLIIMFYHRLPFNYYGIEHLPANIWVVIIYISVLINTWLVCMVVLSILREQPLLYSGVFASILLGWRTIEILNSFNTEPAWYLLSLPLIHLTGIYLAYKLYTLQYENSST